MTFSLVHPLHLAIEYWMICISLIVNPCLPWGIIASIFGWMSHLGAVSQSQDFHPFHLILDYSCEMEANITPMRSRWSDRKLLVWFHITFVDPLLSISHNPARNTCTNDMHLLLALALTFWSQILVFDWWRRQKKNEKRNQCFRTYYFWTSVVRGFDSLQ